MINIGANFLLWLSLSGVMTHYKSEVFHLTRK